MVSGAITHRNTKSGTTLIYIVYLSVCLLIWDAFFGMNLPHLDL